MKVTLVILILVLGTLELTFGQLSEKSVVYGTVRTDGYDKITKGAFWGKRPEAKEIYNGGHPNGFTVVVLDAEMFVRFIDEEHNQNDKNYIVFPKGEIVYSNNQTGKHYSSKCGNEIEFIGPVENIIIKKDFDFVQKPLSFPDQETHFVPSLVVKQVDDYQLPPSLVFETTTVRTKTWFGRKWPIIAGALVASAATTYFLTRGGHSSYVEIRSMPGGIPAAPVVDPLNPTVPVTPGLPSDPRTMPGGLGGFNFHGNGGGGIVLVHF